MSFELPVYNQEGKKLTWDQHQAKMRKHQEKEAIKEVVNEGEIPGLCNYEGCVNSGFELKCVVGSGGTLIRTCKKCGHEKEFPS